MVGIHPMRIPGKWREGYVLDYHTIESVFLGHNEYGHPMFDTQRSEIGELLYRLKYTSDKSVLDEIVETTVTFMKSWRPKLAAIIPTPPSKEGRTFQPVLEVAKGLSDRLEIPLLDVVKKTKATPELKNIYGYEDRLKILEGAHTINKETVKGLDLFLFDDLYRSGATLNAITDLLYGQGEAENVYALALTRTRSTS